MYQSALSVLDNFISPAISALFFPFFPVYFLVSVRFHFLLNSSSLHPTQAVSTSLLLPDTCRTSCSSPVRPCKIVQNIISNDVTSNSFTSFSIIVYQWQSSASCIQGCQTRRTRTASGQFVLYSPRSTISLQLQNTKCGLSGCCKIKLNNEPRIGVWVGATTGRHFGGEQIFYLFQKLTTDVPGGLIFPTKHNIIHLVQHVSAVK